MRRRIPDYSVASYAPRPQTLEKNSSELLESRSPRIGPAEPKKLKNVPRRSPSKTPAPASPIKANVFDVPSSEDEVIPLTPKLVHKTAAKPTKNPSHKSTNPKELIAATIQEVDRRKRMKLSPACQVQQKIVPIKSPPKQDVPRSTTLATKPVNKSLGLVHTSMMATRPKPTAMHRRPDISRTPKRLSPERKASIPSTPSPKASEPDLMDVDTPTQYISPRGLQMWKELLDPLDSDDTGLTPAIDDQADMSDGPVISKARVTGSSLYRSAGIAKHSNKSPRKPPRRRLIDSLVEQSTHQDEVEEDGPDNDEPDLPTQSTFNSESLDISSTSRPQNLAPELSVPQTAPTTQPSQITGPRFTYSRQRSMLEEQDFMQQLALDMPSQPAQAPNSRRPRRGSIPKVKPLQSFHEEDEDDEGAGSTAIRSVHELRRLGANSRFLDEIEDLLDLIGKPTPSPSSMRRSGLLDLASKIKDKNFVRQFRATGIEQRLFVHLGQETDVVAGFMMVSVLMVVLVDASMPHIVSQLRRQGITRLLIRLLESNDGIIALSKDRRSNMSKSARSLILEHQEFLLKISAWEELQPQVITPRVIALKCLEMMVRQTREAGDSGDIFSKELTTKLFSILKSASEETSWELPQGREAIDFSLALSALESHSIMARTVHDESIWLNDYLPIIADTLEVALVRPIDDFGSLQGLILRLTLNVTNNNPRASDVFARSSLMAIMGRVIVVKFSKITRFLTEEDFSIVFDHLVLVLGVMINFAEWSSPARESLQSLQGQGNDPLDDMVQLFIDNETRTSEVSFFASPRCHN